jgi:hypothetical protein
MCQLELLKLIKQRHSTLLLQIRQQLPRSKRFESGNIPIKLRTLGNQVQTGSQPCTGSVIKCGWSG